MIIENAGHDGNFGARVTENGRLHTSSRANTRSFYIARDDGQTYLFFSTFSAATGEVVLHIKNTHTTKKLYIDRMVLSADNNATFSLLGVTAGTAAGTEIIPVNTNFESGNDAIAEVKGNAAVTGLTTNAVTKIKTQAFDTKDLPIHGILQLGQNDELAISYAGTTGDVSVLIEAFYE